jgi:hypothetical protein
MVPDNRGRLARGDVIEKCLIIREIRFVPNAGIQFPVITWGENKSACF